MFYTFTRFNGPTANVKQTDFEQVFSYASDISYAVLATIAGTVAAMQMMVQNKMKNKKVERVLLAQSLTSSVFLIFSTASSCKLFYSLHHYTGLVLLITMSRNFRDKFCDFYHISFLLKRFRRIYKNEASLTVTVLSTTATSKKSNLFRNFSA
uniref:Uncharacterized protein n=1 Tax=Panagrolaimus superbus TaxID=310955 RepID=A0A914YTN2_9BILA